jgi:hypothetical protein
MSIYEDKESYSESIVVAVIGPIEKWWNTEEEPNKFNSSEARRYFHWRDCVCTALAEHFLVYRPHEAFKGPWNEKAQRVNDTALHVADFIVSLKEDDDVALGTDHERELAESFGRPVVNAPRPDITTSTTEYMRLAKMFADTLDISLGVVLD